MSIEKQVLYEIELIKKMAGYILEQKAVITFMKKKAEPTLHLFMQQKKLVKELKTKLKKRWDLNNLIFKNH